MLDYRFHYAQLVIEDRLRQQRPTQASRPATRSTIVRRPRQLATGPTLMAPCDVIATCPVCAGELEISRLHCSSCGTTIEGEFGVGASGG